jgi:hypothetical protein
MPSNGTDGLTAENDRSCGRVGSTGCFDVPEAAGYLFSKIANGLYRHSPLLAENKRPNNRLPAGRDSAIGRDIAQP